MNVVADQVFLHGRIAVRGTEASTVQAVAAKFGKVLAAGTDAEIGSLCGPATAVVDLRGRRVIPGLIDSHSHFLACGGLQATGIVDLSEEAGVRSMADLKARLRQQAAATPPGEWVFGVREDDSKLAERRHPTLAELDEAVPDHPVLLSTIGGHFNLANSRAFEKGGVTAETPDPPGGTFDRDAATGRLTGGLHERAAYLLVPRGEPGREPTAGEALHGGAQALQAAAACGLTCVYDMAGAAELRAAQELRARGELPVRVRVDAGIDLLPQLDALGIRQGLGDEWLKFCGLKIFLDGAISARTAAVSEPYLDRPGFRGVLARGEEDAVRLIRGAIEAGYRVSAHANGDRAIGFYLDIVEEARARWPRPDPRDRIIHCSVVNAELVQRIRRLGLLPTIFGCYAYYHGDKVLPAFGARRAEWMFAARSLLDAGVTVSAHSDYDASPMPPLLGIHALVNRTTKHGTPFGRTQRITVEEAVRLYTANAAYQSFDEGLMGSLEPGKLADMAVLGEDLFTVPSDRIKDVPVEMTIVGGEIVFVRQP